MAKQKQDGLGIMIVVGKSKDMNKMKKQMGKKTKMAYGGMAYGKKHMYTGGGSVTMNPGLAALGKASPKAFKNITGKDPSGN
tara:strand:+ start:1361 stop:1606 length:246 start_codon:yes stop_codon:yes gene_type:complete